MGIGFLILLFGAFLAIIAIRGTYKYLPPWYTPPATAATSLEKAASALGTLNSGK